MSAAEQISIRTATAADAELLFALILELASYEKLADQVDGDVEMLRRSLFEEKGGEALIIETAAGEAIGHAILFTTFSSFECRPGIWLEDVYVRPEHRRGGIGAAVMEHLAALVLEREYARLEWCALTWNEPALSFYEKLGATRLEDWRILRLDGEQLQQLNQARTQPPA